MNHRPKKLLFILHRLYLDGTVKKGGIDRIVEFASTSNAISLIEHPFEKINHNSEFTNNDLHMDHRAIFRGPLLWIEELLINIFWTLKSKTKYDLAIASDPLNFFSCHALKIFGKVTKTQFHSTDYSKPRFNNILLERVYQFLYWFAVTNADFVTVVSTRMADNAKRISTRTPIYLLPNSPDFTAIPKISHDKKLKNSLVLIVGRWGNQVDTERIADCMRELALENNKIKLHIIGHVDTRYRKALEKGNASSYIFHGALPYESALSIMATCSVGITAYKETESYVHYADSIKIREYAAAGLPIVCDSIYATAQEVLKYKAGYVYTTTDQMVRSIVRLIENKNEYEAISKNALHWAKENDKKKLLKALYKNYQIL